MSSGDHDLRRSDTTACAGNPFIGIFGMRTEVFNSFLPLLVSDPCEEPIP